MTKRELLLIFPILFFTLVSNAQLTLREQKYPDNASLFYSSYDCLSDEFGDSTESEDALTKRLNKYLNDAKLPYAYSPKESTVLKELNTLNPANVLHYRFQLFNNLKSNQPSLDSSTVKNTKNKFIESSQFSGDLILESFISNQALPFTLNEPSYTRVYGRPTLSFFNLPFQAEFFYTTEDNSYYNSNFFTFRFDPYVFADNILKTSKNKVEDQFQTLKDINADKEAMDRYNQELHKLASNNEKLLEQQKENLNNKLQKLEELEASSYANSATDKLKDSAYSAGSSYTNTVSNKLLIDSLNQDLLLLKKNYDIALEYQKKVEGYISKVDSLTEKVDSIQSRYNQIESLNPHSVSEGLMNKVSDSSNTIFQKGMHFITTIKEFDIGLINPYYSRSTLNALPVKGVNIKQEFESTNMFYKLTLGKAANQFSQSRLSASPKYQRNVLASQVGFGSEFSNHISFISSTFWDPESVRSESTQMSTSNTVNGVSGSYRINKLIADFEVLFSDTKQFLAGGTEHIKIEKGSVLNHLSLNTSLSLNLNKNSKLKLIIDQKNAEFKSLGSPFLRSDYRMLDINTTHRLLKNKVVLTAFYKLFKDNLSGLSDQNNESRGLGITGQTNLKNLPNVMISYSPFEQGNAHRDTLLRTNSSFKTLTSMITYRKTIKRHMFFSILSYTKSTIDYSQSEGLLSDTRIITFNQSYQNNKTKATIGYVNSSTQPSIDSLSYNSLNANWSVLLKKGEVGLNIQHKYTYSGGKYLMHTGTLSYPVAKNLRLAVDGGIGYLDKMWGLNSRNIWNAIFRVEFKL